jgi:hypothetical protein
MNRFSVVYDVVPIYNVSRIGQNNKVVYYYKDSAGETGSTCSSRRECHLIEKTWVGLL